MDAQALSSNGNSQRRKLVKRPPSHHYTRSSSGFDTRGSPDAQSLDSKRSSHSLRRAPSAPPIRSAAASNTSNGSSSPRHPNPSVFQRSNVSPLLSQGEFTSGSAFSAVPHRLSDPHQLQRRPSQKDGSAAAPAPPPDDLIGAPFDGAAILSRIDSIKIPTSQPSFAQRWNFPPPLVKANTDSRLAKPALRTSVSYGNMDASIVEKPQVARLPENPLMSPKRYSDEGKDSKAGAPRKKSGLSGFMNSLSLVGSQKKPVISAPENPVHVTHVGYDASTGQFTVSRSFHNTSINKV